MYARYSLHKCTNIKDLQNYYANESSKPVTYLYKLRYMLCYTLSGRIGKVVASHAAVARSIHAEVALIYTMREALRGYSPRGWGSTVSDAIVRS